MKILIQSTKQSLIKFIFALQCFLLFFAGTNTLASDRASNPSKMDQSNSAAIENANTLLQEKALKVLILNAVIGAESGTLLDVPTAVRDRWDTIRLSTVGFIQVAAAGIGTFYMGQASSKEFQSVLAPLTYLVKIISHLVTVSANQLTFSLEKIGVDVLLRSSGESLETVIKSLTQVFASFITKGGIISSTTISASGFFASSTFAWFTNTNEVLTYENARSLLGYDKELQKRIDRLTFSLSQLLDFNGDQSATLKRIIENELIRVGIEKQFAQDADYQINLVPPMLEAGLINSKTAAAINGLNELYQIATKNQIEGLEPGSLGESVNVLVALSAILESQLGQENLDRQMEKEIRQQLADVQKTLKLVQATLQ